jgi:hypothetical protein
MYAAEYIKNVERKFKKKKYQHNRVELKKEKKLIKEKKKTGRNIYREIQLTNIIKEKK